MDDSNDSDISSDFGRARPRARRGAGEEPEPRRHQSGWSEQPVRCGPGRERQQRHGEPEFRPNRTLPTVTNDADVDQNGDCNEATVVQDTTGANLNGRINGDNATVDQGGEDNVTTVTQNSHDAVATVLQTGDSNFADVFQWSGANANVS